ncbi:MAG TPA: patatin-like phospholipase family protein [Thermoleophilaceae bacterium]
MAEDAGRVGVVLAGGGARGAYEAGALSVVLPRLARRGERPEVIVGTSVGAINAAYLAASAADPPADVAAAAHELWASVDFDDVVRPLVSPAELLTALGSVGEFLRLPGARLWSLLDPAPLAGTLRRLIPFERIHSNVRDGHLHAAAVVATSAATSRTVVFHDGGGHVRKDQARGIDYAQTRIGVDHVRASAAIPAAFPAVRVRQPRGAAGWYFDGGTRLNTPIKPALELGAERVIVIALNSLHAGRARGRPDALDGVSQLAHAVLVDPLVHDVQTLATVNTALRGRGDGESDHRVVPYMLIAPDRRDVIGEIAMQVYRRHYTGALAAARSPSLALLGHTLDAGKSAARGELFSYLFFAREFAEALMRRGREDAERWFRQRHDDGPWQLRKLRLAA